jgi:hypothetical protein
MTSVRIGEIEHDGSPGMAGHRRKERVSVNINGGGVRGDDVTTASVDLCVTGPHSSSEITLSLDEAQELAALLTNAVTRAAAVIAKAAEHEQEHSDLTARQHAAMDDLLKGEQL